MLFSPERYARSGRFTQRIFESVLAGCLPLVPATLRGADAVVPRELVVTSGPDVLAHRHRPRPQEFPGA
ncbi:hypothetical protein [Kitasatospora sp. NPDC097691]|uniref:hypothetical protein n=1 Tax=Kitasatospora sp. NPDC097691 TaxID=3157231 RepID=UPI003329981B